MDDNSAISQKVETVFNFLMDQQVFIDLQISLFFNQCPCSNYKINCKNQINCQKCFNRNLP